VEDLLHPLLQPAGDHGLGDAVGHGRHAKHPHPATPGLGDRHRPHRRWEVAARRHPIPDLVEVAPQICLERLDRAAVHPRCAPVGLHSLVGLPHLPPGDRKRLVLGRLMVHSTPPGVAGCPNEPTTDGPAPWLHPHYGGFPATTGRSASRPRNGTQRLAVAAAWRAPCRHPHPCGRLCRGLPSHVPRKSRRPGSRRLHAGHHLASRRAPARLILRPSGRRSFDAVCGLSTLQRRFACARLPGPHLTPSRAPSPRRSPPSTISRAQLGVVWSLPPQGGSGGPAILHLSRSTTASKVSYLSNLPSCARGATGMSYKDR
jgi:hypothetical protein